MIPTPSFNDSQREASSPRHSCWVMASAGTGKTKVLVDRLLCLLIEKNHPKSVLCLTYTKAAAKEMTERIQGILNQWSTMDHEPLKTALHHLGYDKCNAEMLEYAKSLFSLVQSFPFAIQTIHSFCQSLLTAHPFEAGLSPGFELLDEVMSHELRQRSIQKTLMDQNNLTHFENVAPFISEAYLREVLNDGLSNRLKIKAYGHPLQKFKEALAVETPLPPLSQKEREEIFSLAEHSLLHGPKVLYNAAQRILETHATDDLSLYDFFLTQEDCVRKKFTLAKDTSREEILQEYGQRVAALKERTLALEVISLNEHLYALIESACTYHQEMKFQQNQVDFDDLLDKTYTLLSASSGWILRNLDRRFDHILVDEAQDISLLQWKIILTLLDHFFDTSGDNGHPRSLFVVGDSKQSIYSFQGADPHFYQDVLKHLQNLTALHQHPFKVISLNTCYRQSPAVLDLVDHIFKDESLSRNLLSRHIQHTPFRKHHKGEVYALPLTEMKEKRNREPWTLLSDTHIENETSHAHTLVSTIEGLYGEYLESQERSATFDDMMILFQRRGTLMGEVHELLTKRGIPCSSSHNHDLLMHLPIKDFLAILIFLDDPHDDYNLACLLKSPLFGVNEETLQDLCCDRMTSLWSRMLTRDAYAPYVSVLNTLREIQSTSPSLFALCHTLIALILPRMLTHYRESVHSVFEALLNLVSELTSQGILSLRAFLNAFPKYASSSKIMGGGGVKLMTIHGSKGLESPIVILADAASASLNSQGNLIFANDFYFLRSSHTPLSTLKTLEKNTDIAETHRLFYVALTRPKDILIITGETSQSKESSWYTHCLPYIAVKSPQEKNYVAKLENKTSEGIPFEIQQQRVYQKPELPSQASLYGQAIHKLMEHHFWALDPASQEQLQKRYHDLPEEVFDTLKSINTHPILAPYFHCAFLTEAEIITGHDNGDGHTLRLDYLRIQDDTITIIDYKTTPHPPKSSSDILESTRIQLKSYAKALKGMYPEKSIECFVLYLHDLSFYGVNVDLSSSSLQVA